MDRLDEGLFTALLDTVFTYAALRHVENDPEIQAVMKKHRDNLAKLSKDAENAIKDAIEAMDKAQAQQAQKQARKKNG